MKSCVPDDVATVNAVQKQLWERKGGMSPEAMRSILLPEHEHFFIVRVEKELLHLTNPVEDSEGEGSQVEGNIGPLGTDETGFESTDSSQSATGDTPPPFDFASPTLGHALQINALPMQPWELDKLEATATQVLNALSTERYTQVFGKVLLQNLQGWQGADEWAQDEGQWIAAMIASDDGESRDKLKR